MIAQNVARIVPSSWGTRAASERRLGWPLMLALGAATGVEFLENTMVVLGAAHIQGGVGATPQEFVWATASYAIVSVLVILAQPRLVGWLGYRHYLTLSLLLDALGTWACGGAHDVTTLVLARAVQAAGGGALFTSCRILLQISFEGVERRKAFWFFAGGLLVGTALAPLMVGIVIDVGEWNGIFYSCLPFVLACAVLIFVTVPPRSDLAATAREAQEQRLEARAHYNYGPILLLCVAMLSAQVALQNLRFEFLMQSPLSLGLLVVSIVTGAGFLWHQWRVKTPLLHLRGLHASPQFRWGLTFYAINYLLTYAFLYVFPVFCEQGLGYTVELTGRLVAFGGLIALIGSAFYLQFGPSLRQQKWVMIPGMLCITLAAWGMSQKAPNVSVDSFYGPLVLYGLFQVLLLNPVALLTFQELEPEFFGHAYRLKNIVRQMCNTFGVAIMTVVLQHREQTHSTALVDQFSPASSWFMTRLAGLSASLIGHGYSPTDAREAALALLHRAADRQVLLLSCKDGFILVALLSLIGLVLLVCQNKLK